MTWHITRFCRT